MAGGKLARCRAAPVGTAVSLRQAVAVTIQDGCRRVLAAWRPRRGSVPALAVRQVAARDDRLKQQRHSPERQPRGADPARPASDRSLSAFHRALRAGRDAWRHLFQPARQIADQRFDGPQTDHGRPHLRHARLQRHQRCVGAGRLAHASLVGIWRLIETYAFDKAGRERPSPFGQQPMGVAGVRAAFGPDPVLTT
jgi:hypothetical protein